MQNLLGRTTFLQCLINEGETSQLPSWVAMIMSVSVYFAGEYNERLLDQKQTFYSNARGVGAYVSLVMSTAPSFYFDCANYYSELQLLWLLLLFHIIYSESYCY